ncbi:MAG: hypothetical protein M3323_10615 [Actinomycetota bacterium]|nr:hypothetical protein [Actinomycetota bacterium]
MTLRRVADASLRAGFADELLARLARTAARRTAFRRLAPGAAVTASVALLVSARRRGR